MTTFESVLTDDQRAEFPKVSDEDATYPNGYTITHIFTKKLDTKFDDSHVVSFCYEIDYSGVPLHEGTRKDPIVTAQRALKSTFDTTEDMRDFAEKYATCDDPYKVHFNDIGKAIKTPEQRQKEIQRSAKKMSSEERKALLAELQAIENGEG